MGRREETGARGGEESQVWDAFHSADKKANYFQKSLCDLFVKLQLDMKFAMLKMLCELFWFYTLLTYMYVLIVGNIEIFRKPRGREQHKVNSDLQIPWILGTS